MITASVNGVMDESGNVQEYPVKWTFRLMPKVGGPVDNCPVAGILCPGNKTMINEPGLCGAQVFFPDVKPSSYCSGSGITIQQTGGLASGFFSRWELPQIPMF